MDYANTTNVEFIVDPKVLFHGWLIYSYLQIFKLIKCKWLPGEGADWFFENIITWSYCLHRRYSMSQQKNSILINEHARNREPVPLKVFKSKCIVYSRTKLGIPLNELNSEVSRNDSKLLPMPFGFYLPGVNQLLVLSLVFGETRFKNCQ